MSAFSKKNWGLKTFFDVPPPRQIIIASVYTLGLLLALYQIMHNLRQLFYLIQYYADLEL